LKSMKTDSIPVGSGISQLGHKLSELGKLGPSIPKIKR